MSRVRVSTVESVEYALAKKNPPNILMWAKGTVPTSGWSKGELSPWIYIQPPADGILDFDFNAQPPSGIVLQVVSAIEGRGHLEDVNIENYWGPGKPLVGFRVHATDNSVEKLLNEPGVEPRQF